MKITVFERRNQKLAPRSVFVKRQLFSLAIGLTLLGCFLLIGIAGYHWIAGLDWIDSLLEASMILGGMGPINPPQTSGAKVFASLYALFSGVIFIALMGIILSPLAHRMLHRFHVDDKDEES
ncbi:MAG TPA: hypothetical protein VGJ55_03100 [Pyrinomonadaceae bacterium]